MTDSEMKRMETRIILATQVRFWMRRFNMDVKAVAKESGLSYQMVYKILSSENSASMDTVASLADAFKIQPAVLLMPIKDNGGDE